MTSVKIFWTCVCFGHFIISFCTTCTVSGKPNLTALQSINQGEPKTLSMFFTFELSESDSDQNHAVLLMENKWQSSGWPDSGNEIWFILLKCSYRELALLEGIVSSVSVLLWRAFSRRRNPFFNSTLSCWCINKGWFDRGPWSWIMLCYVCMKGLALPCAPVLQRFREEHCGEWISERSLCFIHKTARIIPSAQPVCNITGACSQ